MTQSKPATAQAPFWRDLLTTGFRFFLFFGGLAVANYVIAGIIGSKAYERDWGPPIPHDVMLRNGLKLGATIAAIAMGIHLAMRVGREVLIGMGYKPPPEPPLSSGTGHYTPRSPWQLTEKQWEEVERMAGKKRNRPPTE
jgi:hypothetical protein